MRTVRLLLGIPSDRDFLRYCVEQVVDQQQETITSQKYFSSSFRDAVGRLEGQNRLLTSLLVIALLQPQKVQEVLGKQVEQLPFMSAVEVLSAMQALLATLERSVAQT
jgi:hypothetical protein